MPKRVAFVPLHALVLSILGCSIFARAELPDYPLTFGEMKVLAGYYTAGGKYLGGRPKAAKQERQGAYECLAFNAGVPGNESARASPTVCMEYTVEGSTFGLGLCECKETTTSQEHCSTWMCNSNSNTQSSLCSCDVENASDLFCDSWSCTAADSDGVKGHGVYECKRASSSGHYCEAWNGKSTPEGGADGEVVVEACECAADANGNRVCSVWNCQEIALAEFAREMDVAISYGLFGSFVIAILCYLAMNDSPFRLGLQAHGKPLFFYVALTSAFVAYKVVLSAGVDGAALLGVMWGTPIVVTVVRRRLVDG